MATAIFYTTSTGTTTEIAEKISHALGDIEVFDLGDTSVEKINDYDKVIIGVSTWGEGELNDDFEDIWDDFTELDLSSKTIALFGLGDQEGYADEFCNALGVIYDHIKTTGANIIGFTSTDGYEYDISTAVVDGKFVGLVIDEDNQDDLTDERIENWAESIKSDIL
ncbi:MAG: flavodoxin [Arcobacter sp.]|nr:flavodoxin [Arcobacter sp.]